MDNIEFTDRHFQALIKMALKWENIGVQVDGIRRFKLDRSSARCPDVLLLVNTNGVPLGLECSNLELTPFLKPGQLQELYDTVIQGDRARKEMQCQITLDSIVAEVE